MKTAEILSVAASMRPVELQPAALQHIGIIQLPTKLDFGARPSSSPSFAYLDERLAEALAANIGGKLNRGTTLRYSFGGRQATILLPESARIVHVNSATTKLRIQTRSFVWDPGAMGRGSNFMRLQGDCSSAELDCGFVAQVDRAQKLSARRSMLTVWDRAPVTLSNLFTQICKEPP